MRFGVRTVVLAVAAALALTAAASADAPPSGTVSARSGAALYAANCSSCHGPRGRGIPPPGKAGAGGIVGMGPSLTTAGASAADFYIRTGYMPLGSPHDQPWSSRVLFSEREIRALVRYVASLGHGPSIPSPQPERGNLRSGLELFTSNCAGCHQVAAEGGYVTGARVPPLTGVTGVQVAEAVRAGPYLMPRFTKRQITDRELDSLIRYVEYAKAPRDPGGWSIGRIGPVPEGIVAWFLAASVLVATCLVLGRRLQR
jgi:ubiquinol-cytochrome c reductase cytochrome c subunit